MGQTTGFVAAFTAGEISEDAWERGDLEQHQKGCELAANLIVLTAGPLASRGGFLDIGPAAVETTAGRVFGFSRTGVYAHLLEFFDEGFRVYSALGVPVMDGMDPLEIATPFTAAQLAGLWLRPVGDVIYVTHTSGLIPPYVIARLAEDDWTVTAFELRDGPWLTENVDKDFTLTVDSVNVGTGAAVVASKDLFTADHVGALFRLRAQVTGASMRAWIPGDEDWDDDHLELATSAGNIYRTRSAADIKTGTNPPVHEFGVDTDGLCKWEYLHQGDGIIRITAVSDAQNATATIVTMLPTNGTLAHLENHDRRYLDLADNPEFPATPYWAEQAFSTFRGWPTAPIAEWQERLCLASSPTRPSEAFLTRTAGFTPVYGDFRPGKGTGLVVADDAVRFIAGKSGAPIVWVEGAVFLSAATPDAEFVISGGNIDDPIEPSSVGTKEISAFGAQACLPLVVHGPPPALLMATRGGFGLREIHVAPDRSSEIHDLTVLAGHLVGPEATETRAPRGIAELAWQKPDEIAWARLTDGFLAALTFHQEHGVRAWSSQPLPGGWSIESLTVADGADGSGLVWALVTRTFAETTQRRLWRMARRAEKIWQDGAVIDTGSDLAVTSDQPWRAGETLAILADGARIADAVADEDGVVTIPHADAGTVISGYPLVRDFKSLPVDLEGPGTTIGRQLRPTHATLTVTAVEADIGMVEKSDEAQSWLDSFARVQARNPTALAAPRTQRMKERVELGGGADRDNRLRVTTSAPFDLVIGSYRLEAEASK